MNKHHLLWFGSAAMVLVASPVYSQDKVPLKWNPHIEAEGKLGTDRSLGELGLFIPFLQNDKTLFFADIRGRFDDQSSREGNFGLGVRHQINKDWIVGGYAFYDRRKTENNNYFHQATIGVEALTENMEFRANGYIPERGAQDIVGGGSSSSASVNGANLQITTTNSTLREQAIPGFDFEAGYSFDFQDNIDVWAYGGAYHFNTGGVEKVAGPRGRIELNYNNVPYIGEGSRFTLGYEVQHDDVRDTQGFAIARLRVPLNFGKNAASPSDLSALDRRMTTRVVRDIDIVSGQASTISTSTTENATATTAGGATVSSFVTIDAGDDISTEVTNAGSNALIVVDGSAGTINDSDRIEIEDGQTIIGGGASLTVLGATSGATATLTLPGTRPTVNNTDTYVFNGSNLTNGFQLENIIITGGSHSIIIEGSTSNVSLKNINVSGYADRGFHDNTTTGNNISITDSTFTGGSSGLEFGDGSNFTLNNVNVSGVTNAAFYIKGGHTTTNISFSNIVVDNVDDVVFLQSGTSVINNPSGAITATNVGGANCNKSGGTINGSTLLINGVLCN